MAQGQAEAQLLAALRALARLAQSGMLAAASVGEDAAADVVGLVTQVLRQVGGLGFRD